MKRILILSLVALVMLASCTKVSPTEPTQKITVDFTGQAPNISLVEFTGLEGQGNFYVAGSNDIKEILIPLGHYSLKWTLKAKTSTNCTVQFYFTDGAPVSLAESGIQTIDLQGRLNAFLAFGKTCN